MPSARTSTSTSSYAARSETRASVRRPAGAQPERGRHVDDVRDLREVGQLGADLERDAREPLRDQRGKVVDRLGDVRRAHEAADAAGRHAAIDGPGPPFLPVDVPARAALEPTALIQAELARVTGALERGLHEDRGAVGTELEIEARAKRLVAEAELHHLRLEDHPASLEVREEIGGVFPADLDANAARAVVLEAREDPQRLAIGGGLLRLELEQRGRGERRPRVGVEQRDHQGAGAHLHAVLDGLRGRRHRLGQPGIDAVRARATPALVRAIAAVAAIASAAVVTTRVRSIDREARPPARVAAAVTDAAARSLPLPRPLCRELARAAASAPAPAHAVHVASAVLPLPASAVLPASLLAPALADADLAGAARAARAVSALTRDGHPGIVPELGASPWLPPFSCASGRGCFGRTWSRSAMRSAATCLQ